jgi:hypothetical protein
MLPQDFLQISAKLYLRTSKRQHQRMIFAVASMHYGEVAMGGSD